MKEQGGEALRHSCVMGGRQPITHNDLMQNRIPRGEMRESKVVLILPCSNLSSNDDGDHCISLRYLYLVIWNFKATPILIDDIERELKCVSPHNRLLEVRTGRVLHVLRQVHIEL